MKLGSLARRDAPVWSVAQYVVTRTSAALGWMLVARSTGPADFGHFSVLLIALAVLDAVSMPGLNQAIVQRQTDEKINLSLAWLIQFVRGAALAATLYGVIRVFYSETYKALTEPLVLIFCAHIVLKNGQSLWPVTLQRQNDFRAFFGFEAISAALELSSLALLISLGYSPITAYVFAITLGATFRLIVSWRKQPLTLGPIRFDAAFLSLWEYGRWVWATSLLVVAANFTDKLFASSMSAPQLGVYQMSSRFAQLIFADWAAAYSGYLFPRMSQMKRSEKLAKKYGLRRAFAGFGIGIILLVTFAILPINILGLLFGEAWSGAESLFLLHGASMTIGAVIAVLSAAIKAHGKPKVIFIALVGQVTVLAFSIYPLWWTFGLYGLVYANLLALSTCALVLTAFAIRSRV